MAGELFAEGKVRWPLHSTHNERSDAIERDDAYGKLSNELMERATAQSHRLASMLALSLQDSTGIQKSLAANRLRYEYRDKNGCSSENIRTFFRDVTHMFVISIEL